MTKTYNDSSLWIRHLQVLRARHNGNAYLSVAQDPVHGTDMAVEACWEYILPYDLPKNLTAYWYPERTPVQRRSAHGVLLEWIALQLTVSIGEKRRIIA